MNQEHEDKMKTLHTWIKHLTWEENHNRSDAQLSVVIDPVVGTGNDPDADACRILLSCSKQDYIDFAESLCSERIDSFSIDAIHIEMDGDREDTNVRIKADIHLAE